MPRRLESPFEGSTTPQRKGWFFINNGGSLSMNERVYGLTLGYCRGEYERLWSYAVVHSWTAPSVATTQARLPLNVALPR